MNRFEGTSTIWICFVLLIVFISAMKLSYKVGYDQGVKAGMIRQINFERAIFRALSN